MKFLVIVQQPSLAESIASLRASAAAPGGQSGWLPAALEAMIMACLLRLFARLEHLIQLWQSGNLATFPDRNPSRAPQATHAGAYCPPAPSPSVPPFRGLTDRAVRRGQAHDDTSRANNAPILPRICLPAAATSRPLNHPLSHASPGPILSCTRPRMRLRAARAPPRLPVLMLTLVRDTYTLNVTIS